MGVALKMRGNPTTAVQELGNCPRLPNDSHKRSQAIVIRSQLDHRALGKSHNCVTGVRLDRSRGLSVDPADDP